MKQNIVLAGKVWQDGGYPLFFTGGKMRRPIQITLALLILAGLYTLLPFFFGIAAERYAYNFLNHENATLGNVIGFHLDFEQYNRGWFKSTAILQVEQKTNDGNYEIIKSIPVVIKHGPTYRRNDYFRAGLGMIESQNFRINDQLPYVAHFRESIGFAGEHGAFVLVSKNPDDAVADNFRFDSLALHMQSNLKANQFKFLITGNGLHYQDAQQSFSINIQKIQSTLQADYLSEQNWQLTLGFGLDNSQVSAVLPDAALTKVVLNADKINLNNIHLNTQTMAKTIGEMVQLKQAEDANQPVKATAWMALFQQFLTQMIQDNTSASVAGLAVSTPMGELSGEYDVSFPTLSNAHDYFDVATRNVGVLQVDVPHWMYADVTTNTQFALDGLHYREDNNTVFSRRSSLVFNALNVKNTQTSQDMVNADGFSYQGELLGDVRNLSQTMQWKLAKFCFSTDCFNQINGKLELAKMNFDAFRGIADATRKVVQYDPNETQSVEMRWMNLANAYVKLITPDTQITLSDSMLTPEGKVEMNANLSWPNLIVNTPVAPTAQTFMTQSVYEFHLLFPAAYVNAFLTQQAVVNAPSKQVSATPAAAEQPLVVQVAQFLQYALSQGYLKKVGDAYTVDLAGNGSNVTVNAIPWKAPS